MPMQRDEKERISLISKSILVLVRGYRYCVSPLLVAFFGPQAGCRFAPTCSQYAAACFQHHSFFRASWLTLKRIGRCHPYHPGGYDPAPD